MLPVHLLIAVSLDAANPESVAATVNGRNITIAELDQRAGARLESVRVQEHAIRRQVLDDLIASILLESEAAKRGIFVSELLRIEVTEKVPPNKGPVADPAPGKAGKPVPPPNASRNPDDLGVRTARRKNAFIQSLRRQAALDVRLEGPRVSVSADDDPSLGPADAPVTIVQFSDYQCPFCRSVQATMTSLREKFGANVRVVYRDFPLSSSSPAATAAEAAACARDQGKFWEMHEKLFEQQRTLADADYGAFAADVGIEKKRFQDCLTSRRHQAEWQHDVEQGRSYGVNGTPMTFVNGRPVPGALSLELFSSVVEEELQRAATE